MRCLAILLIIYMCLPTRLTAQSVAITGKVTGSQGPLSGATISLLNAKDSAWQKSEFTDDGGAFILKDISPGKYLVAVTYIGYVQTSKAVEVFSSDLTCDILLVKDSTALADVSVTAKKPFIEMSIGKTIVNIEGSATTAGANALDLMRRLPGILIDQGGNITMHGKQGVLVLIDDRPTYLSGDDLAAYLKTITADEISQIELITQPGAKYDAAGNTGIINIKLKKNKQKGWNGNITLGCGQGVYFQRNESLLLSYKNNKWNFLLSASDFAATGFADWQEQLHILDNQGNMLAGKMVHSTEREDFSNTTLRAAIDYTINDKLSAGANLSGTYHPNVNHTDAFSTTTDNTTNILTYNSIYNPDGFIRKNIISNAYLSEKFSKTNTLDINFDYLHFNKNELQTVADTSFNQQMAMQGNPQIENSQLTYAINIYSFKADEACTIAGIKMETGIKSSWVTSNNHASYWQYENNAWILDTVGSNHFLYRENINAAYVSLDKTLGSKWEVRGGLRGEQTNIQGAQTPGSYNFSNEYISLFPTAYVTYKKDSNNLFEINYGRRIDRPAYNSLNPFVTYSFQDIYYVGNPQLQPQFTNNIELKHSYKNMLITSLEYSNTQNVMTGMLVVNDTTKDVYNTQLNIRSSNSADVSVAFNKDLFKWWALNASASAYYSDYTGLISNIRKNISWTGYSGNINSRFDIGKGWKAEISAFYTGSGRWSFTSSYQPFGDVDFGVSKKIKESLLVKFYANDPLYIFRLRSQDASYNYWMYTRFRNATRAFTISATWTFGKSHAGEKRSHQVDEEKRLGI